MRLSTQQRIIAWRLALQPFVSRPEIVRALWGSDPDGGALATANAISIRIGQLRRLLPVEINTRWGFGYVVPEEQRPQLLDVLAAEIASNVSSSADPFSEAA